MAVYFSNFILFYSAIFLFSFCPHISTHNKHLIHFVVSFSLFCLHLNFCTCFTTTLTNNTEFSHYKRSQAALICIYLLRYMQTYTSRICVWVIVSNWVLFVMCKAWVFLLRLVVKIEWKLFMKASCSMKYIF